MAKLRRRLTEAVTGWRIWTPNIDGTPDALVPSSYRLAVGWRRWWMRAVR